jgi:hypothetical protein
LYENVYALSRAFVVSRVSVLDSQEQVWDALEHADLTTTALVAEPLSRALDGNMPLKEVEVLGYTTNALAIRVRLEEPGMLVASQTWAPGWRATDNGETVPVYRVDYALQGVYLGAGEHTVELVYRPRIWPWGLAGTAFGMAVAVCCIVLPRRGKRDSCC